MLDEINTLAGSIRGHAREIRMGSGVIVSAGMIEKMAERIEYLIKQIKSNDISQTDSQAGNVSNSPDYSRDSKPIQTTTGTDRTGT